MNENFPEFELERYNSIICKNISWLDLNLDSNYMHIHANGSIENKKLYLKNISSDNIKFITMKPITWTVREESKFIFITGLSNFKNLLDLHLVYHSIWKKDLKLTLFSWQATESTNK